MAEEHTTNDPSSSHYKGPEESDDGAGIYAIANFPCMGLMDGTALIPLKYNIPTRQTSAGESIVENGQVRHQNGAAPLRQVVERMFRFAFQLDFLLMLKLAVMIFFLGRGESTLKLIVLIFIATLIYLYQTGTLQHIFQWLRLLQVSPPQQPPRQLNNGATLGHNNQNDPQLENLRADNQNVPDDRHQHEIANENQQEQGHGNWLNFVKEIKVFIVGFLTSLVPGFQHND